MTARTRQLLPLMLAATGVAQAASANLSPCEVPPETRSFSIAYAKAPDTSLRAGDAGLRRTQTSLDSGKTSERIRLRFAHTYSAYQLKPASGETPASNGHVHTLSTDIDLSETVGPGWTLRLQPALSVSSNLLKSPGRIEPQGLQMNIAGGHTLFRNSHSHWQIGVCADHRFGPYSVYPTTSWEWRNEDWRLLFGWPDNRLYRQLSRTLSAGVRLSPGGNRWHTLGSTGDYAWLTHRAWSTRLLLAWRPTDFLGLELSYERLYRNRLDVALESGSVHRMAGSHLALSALRFIWYY